MKLRYNATGPGQTEVIVKHTSCGSLFCRAGEEVMQRGKPADIPDDVAKLLLAEEPRSGCKVRPFERVEPPKAKRNDDAEVNHG